MRLRPEWRKWQSTSFVSCYRCSVAEQFGTESMKKEEWMSCVFCGLEFPHKDYAKDREALIDHIRVCPKHPMSKLIRDYDRVRGAPCVVHRC